MFDNGGNSLEQRQSQGARLEHSYPGGRRAAGTRHVGAWFHGRFARFPQKRSEAFERAQDQLARHLERAALVDARLDERLNDEEK